MGKNSGFKQTNQQVQNELDYTRNRSTEFDSFLRGLFGPSFDDAKRFNEDAYGKFNNVYDSFGRLRSDFGRVSSTGLADEYSASRPFYHNLIKTGGFSNQDKQLFRRNALAPTTGFWDSFKEEMRRSNATNPYNVGAGAQNASTARKAAQDISETGISAETNLNQMIREGQLAGAAGDERIAGAINSNKLAGMSGEAGALQGQMGAASGISGLGERMLGFAHSLIDNMLANASLDSSTRNSLLRLKAEMNPKSPGFFDRLMQVGQIAGNLGTTAIGMGGLFGRNNRGNTGVAGGAGGPV